MSAATLGSQPGQQPMRTGLSWTRAMTAVVLMVAAAVLSSALTPRERQAAWSADVVLEDALPRSFKGWRVDEGRANSVVNPQQANLLKALYSQNLSRIYVDGQGRYIMLSIAYGGTQGGGLELHRPEICYVAQGFSIKRDGTSSVNIEGLAKAVPMQRLMSENSRYQEPISYWMRVGDDVMVSGASQQFARIRNGLQGMVPDGVLFRVSTVSSDPQAAYALQEQFVQDLLASSPPRLRNFLVGPVSANRDNRKNTPASP